VPLIALLLTAFHVPFNKVLMKNDAEEGEDVELIDQVFVLRAGSCTFATSLSISLQKR
jgi:hypothetical protein